MTAKICDKLADLESEIANLNIKLSKEEGDSFFLKFKLNKNKLTDNMRKVKQLQNDVNNLIQQIENQLVDNK